MNPEKIKKRIEELNKKKQELSEKIDKLIKTFPQGTQDPKFSDADSIALEKLLREYSQTVKSIELLEWVLS